MCHSTSASLCCPLLVVSRQLYYWCPAILTGPVSLYVRSSEVPQHLASLCYPLPYSYMPCSVIFISHGQPLPPLQQSLLVALMCLSTQPHYATHCCPFVVTGHHSDNILWCYSVLATLPSLCCTSSVPSL